MSTTKEVLSLLNKWIADIKDQWARGDLQGPDIETTALANASAVGQVGILQQILELDYEQLSQGLRNE